MSHEITINDGKAEFVFTGSRKEIWHGLGAEMPADATKEEWLNRAGMAWTAKECPMYIMGDEDGKEFTQVADRKLITRSDNGFQLGIVGTEYKVVQPAAVMGFFDDLIRLNGMKLSTAGTLYGGRRFWALAETGEAEDVVAGDEVRAYVLLVTSVDGTMSTQAGFTSTRVVCNNTMNIALANAGKKFVKVTHHKEWDASAVKVDMGLLSRSWADYMGNLRKLSSVKMDQTATADFFQKLYYDPKKDADNQSLAERRIVTQLIELAENGVGSDLSRGTAWGALNAATELFTHWSGSRKPDIQFADSYTGAHAKQKDVVFNALMEMVA